MNAVVWLGAVAGFIFATRAWDRRANADLDALLVEDLPPLPRREPRLHTEWERITDFQMQAWSDIADGSATPVFDRLLMEQAREVLADDERIWAEIGGAS